MKTEALRVVSIAGLVCCSAMAVRAQKWERIGPEGGNAISLAETGDGEVLLGTPDGHVFASSDGGERWELRGRVGNRTDGVAQGLVTDLRRKTRVFAAVWTQDPAAGGGVFRSEDGGRTWTASGLQGEAVRALAQSASSPDVFVAGARTGVFRSADAGKNWERISPAGDEELRNLDSIAIDPRNANVIYLGTYHLPWKTTDGGKSWKPIAVGMIDDSDVMSVVVDRSDPERIFASACSGIYRSGNGGAQWTKLQGIPYVSRRTQQIAQDPGNAAVWYAGTTEGLWRSKDGGESWERLTGRDAVVNAIAFTEKGTRLLLGTEDGILLGMDSLKTFAARNVGFAHPVVRAFAVSETDSRHLVVAVEGDAGLRESIDEGKSWRVFSGPTGPVNVLFSVGDNWYAALRGGGAAQFDAKTSKWKEIRFVVMEMERNSGKGGSTQAKQMRERIRKPEVSAMTAVGGRLFVATGKGLWAGGTRAGVLQRALGKQFAEKVMDLAVDSCGKRTASHCARPSVAVGGRREDLGNGECAGKRGRPIVDENGGRGAACCAGRCAERRVCARIGDGVGRKEGLETFAVGASGSRFVGSGDERKVLVDSDEGGRRLFVEGSWPQLGAIGDGRLRTCPERCAGGPRGVGQDADGWFICGESAVSAGGHLFAIAETVRRLDQGMGDGVTCIFPIK